MPGLEDSDYTQLIERVPVQRSLMDSRWIIAQRLKRIFGETPPVDATIDEIRQGGLPVLLASGAPLAYFMLSTLHQRCPENLFFYLEAHWFTVQHFESTAALQECATCISSGFLTRNSEFEVNLDAEDHDEVMRRIRAGRQDCFAVAAQHVVGLMMPGYMAFLDSPLYQLMCNRLGTERPPYSREARQATVESIVAFLDEHVPPPPQATEEAAGYAGNPRETVLFVEPGELSVPTMRDQMVRAMVHQFCRSRLRFDFADTAARRRVELADSAAARARMRARCRHELDNMGREGVQSVMGGEMGMPHASGPGAIGGQAQRIAEETDYTRLIFPQHKEEDFMI